MGSSAGANIPGNDLGDVLSVVVNKEIPTPLSFRNERCQNDSPTLAIGNKVLEFRVIKVHMHQILRHMETVSYRTFPAHGTFGTSIGIVGRNAPHLVQICPCLFSKTLSAHDEFL